MKEYKIAKGWSIFIFVASPFLLGLFVWVLTIPFQNGNYEPSSSWIIIPIALGMIAIIIFGLIDTIQGRIIIQQDRIIAISLFKQRELKLDEIIGYTINENYIFIEPISNTKKRIKISKYIGGYDEILLWISQQLPDLETQSAMIEEQRILSDDNIGWSTEMRAEKLAKARKTAKIINWCAGISFAWVLFYPSPYQYALLPAIIIPIIAMIVLKFSNGLIKFDEKKGSAYPTIIHAFIFPSLALMLRAVLDFDIFDYSKVFLPTTVFAIFLLFVLFLKQQEFKFKSKQDVVAVCVATVFVIIYSFGTIIHVNCFYDQSNSKQYSAQVLSKRISSGKTTTYYFKLSPWGPQLEENEVSVDEENYNHVVEGAEVKIYYKTGLLEIPWLIVSSE